MEQNYRPEDPNVSDLRKAMIIRGAILAGFQIDKRRDGALVFHGFDSKTKKLIYLDVPGTRMPVSYYATCLQKIAEFYNLKVEEFENEFQGEKLSKMPTDYEIIQGNPAVKGKAFKTIQGDMADEIYFYMQMLTAYGPKQREMDFFTNYYANQLYRASKTFTDALLEIQNGVNNHNGYTQDLYEELYSYVTSPEIADRIHFSKKDYDEEYLFTFGEHDSTHGVPMEDPTKPGRPRDGQRAGGPEDPHIPPPTSARPIETPNNGSEEQQRG